MMTTMTTTVYWKSICQEAWWKYTDVSGNVTVTIFYSEVTEVNMVTLPYNETARDRIFYRCRQVPFHTDI
jgi:hypothetical protein